MLEIGIISPKMHLRRRNLLNSVRGIRTVLLLVRTRVQPQDLNQTERVPHTKVLEMIYCTYSVLLYCTHSFFPMVRSLIKNVLRFLGTRSNSSVRIQQ